MPLDMTPGIVPDTVAPLYREPAPLLDEQALSCFLVSARCGCFMQAARSLNLKSTQLRKKLAALEARLGYALFVNRGHNLVLTREGRQLQARLQASLPRHPPALARLDAPVLVRLAVAEPLLHDLLGRNLIAFVRQHAGIRLEVNALSGGQLPAADTDVALWLAERDIAPSLTEFDCAPPRPLALLSYLPHIAKRYSREVTRPTRLSDLQDYMLVQCEGDARIAAFAPWNAMLQARAAGVTLIQGYEMYCQLIKCSACIGLLAHYAPLLDRGLLGLPDLITVPMQRQAWLAVNSRSAHTPLVQVLVSAIHAAFEERQEWFSGAG